MESTPAPPTPPAARGPIADAARSFARRTLAPRIAGWEESRRFPREATRDAGRLGLTGLFAPPELGGRGLGAPETVDAFEELGRVDAAFAFLISMHNLVTAAICGAGSDAVIERWGRALTSGEALGGFVLTEPQSGSDAVALRTLATPTADGGWRLSGEKAWVSLGGEADVFIVVAKTLPEPGHRDIAIFVVERDDPGVTFGPPYDTMAARWLPITDARFDAVALGPERLLVPPGQGLRAALAAIDQARLNVAAGCCGILAESLEVATAYARRRYAFGSPIAELEAIQWKLADLATDLEASRLLVRQAAGRLGTPDGSVACAHAKRFVPDAALRGAAEASQVLGAYGWTNAYPLARFIALARMAQSVDGTTEIQRLVIARSLLRE